MQKTHTTFVSSISIILFALLTMFAVMIVGSQSAHAAQPTVDLGSASPFAILSGTPNITDAGNSSVIRGNVGLSPSTGAGNGLMCSQVIGTIYSVDAAGPSPCRITDGPLLLRAKNSLTAAYTDAAGRTPATTVSTELGGQTLVAGVYDSASTRFDITAGAGPLTLDGQGDPSSVFIFESSFEGTGLAVGSASSIVLENGAQACNIFWRVNSASINTTANFVGTILALNSITVANGATIEGRLLARNGNVTLINDTITAPICAGNDTADSGDVIPGLPNSGETTPQYILLGAIVTFLVAIGFLLAFVTRKWRSL